MAKVMDPRQLFLHELGDILLETRHVKEPAMA